MTYFFMEHPKITSPSVFCLQRHKRVVACNYCFGLSSTWVDKEGASFILKVDVATMIIVTCRINMSSNISFIICPPYLPPPTPPRCASGAPLGGSCSEALDSFDMWILHSFDCFSEGVGGHPTCTPQASLSTKVPYFLGALSTPRHSPLQEGVGCPQDAHPKGAILGNLIYLPPYVNLRVHWEIPTFVSWGGLVELL